MTIQAADESASDFDRQISRMVKLAMWDSGMTQKEVALAAGMNTASMSRSMNGLRPWRAAEVVLIAAATGVDVSVLLPHLDSNQEPSGYVSSQVTALPLACPFGCGEWHTADTLCPQQLDDVVVDLAAYRLERVS